MRELPPWRRRSRAATCGGARKDPTLGYGAALSPTGGEDCFIHRSPTHGGPQTGLPAVPLHPAGARLSAAGGARGVAASAHTGPQAPHRDSRSPFQDECLRLARGSPLRRELNVTFPEVPLYGDGGTPSVLSTAHVLDLVRVGQATDAFEKYPVSDRPGFEFWLISWMLCGPSQVSSPLWTPMSFICKTGTMTMALVLPLVLL